MKTRTFLTGLALLAVPAGLAWGGRQVEEKARPTRIERLAADVEAAKDDA